MDRKIVIVNAEKMDYDHRLDFSAMGTGAEIYPDSTPREILERAAGAEVLVTKELPVPGGTDPQPSGECEADLRGGHRLQQHRPGRLQGAGDHGVQRAFLLHPAGGPHCHHDDFEPEQLHGEAAADAL